MKTSFCWLLSLLFFSARTSQGQTLRVSGLTASGNQLTITVRDTGASTGYQLQGSPAMATG